MDGSKFYTLFLLTVIVLAWPFSVYGETKIKASDGQAGDNFGWSVSVSGDLMVVGAMTEDDNGEDAGAVYVFRKNGDTWTEEQKLTASDGQAFDLFGRSVSISEDVIVVGADLEDAVATGAGAAYVFRFNSNANNWEEEKKLTASDGAAHDNYGRSVSISGNVIVIGAFLANALGSDDSGSAYVYRYNDSTRNWNEEQKLTASDGVDHDEFGRSVSVSGDSIGIGALLEDTNGKDSGSVYLFRYNRITNKWNEEQKIIASDGEAFDNFGFISISGDILAIGSYLEDTKGSGAGKAYVYRFIPSHIPPIIRGIWGDEKIIKASDGAAGDEFGWAISLSEDVLVVGAQFEDENGEDSGAAFVYHKNGNNWNQVQKLKASDGQAHDHYGRSISYSKNTIVVGARGDDDNGTTAGAAYVYQADASAPSPPGNLASSNVTANSLTLSWNASTDNFSISGYKVFRDGDEISLRRTITFDDTGLKPQTTYEYRVKSVDTVGNESDFSDPHQVTTLPPPDTEAPTKPNNLSATNIGPNSLTLQWNASTDNVAVTGYKIIRDGEELGTSPDNSFIDTGLAHSTTYEYTVIAFDDAGNESPPSDPFQVMTLFVDESPPTKPDNLQATTVTGNSITLEWAAAEDNIGVTEYKVYRDGVELPPPTPTTSFTDTGLTHLTTYEYTVKAFDGANNESSFSDPLQIKTGQHMDVEPGSSTSVILDPPNMIRRVINPPEDFESNGQIKSDKTPIPDKHPDPVSVFHAIFEINFALQSEDLEDTVTIDILVQKPGDVFKKIGEVTPTLDSKPETGPWEHQFYWVFRQPAFEWTEADAQPFKTDGQMKFRFVVR